MKIIVGDGIDTLNSIKQSYITERAKLLTMILRLITENVEKSEEKVKRSIEKLAIIDNNLSTIDKFFKENE